MASDDILARIKRLPKGRREEAVRLMSSIGMARMSEPGRGRDPVERRKYAKDPLRYIREVLGWFLTPQQEKVIAAAYEYDRLLVPSANNVGKTWVLATIGLHHFDAIAALPDDDDGLEEQGCKLLLPGPDHATVFATVYSELITHAARAESRGYVMPGEYSDRSVHWPVRAKWNVEAFSPRKHVEQDIAHSASGRHHKNQLALIEEGQGVEEPTWAATEGMCSSEGNKIISSFNPSNPFGPAYTRAETGMYHVIHLDAFSHPNIRGRQIVVPSAVSFKTIDERVRRDCTAQGEYPETVPDPQYREFVYALAPRGTAERGPREDQHPGHPDGKLQVYRPNVGSNFEAQVLGQYPQVSENRLFDMAAWDRATARWIAKRGERYVPDGPPTRVGCDLARTGGDEIFGAPVWGESADSLLHKYALLVKEGAEKVEDFKRTHRVHFGEFKKIPPGDGERVAAGINYHFPNTHIVADEGGVGSSPVDFLRRLWKRSVSGISFGAGAPAPPPGITHSENMRTWMHVLAARCVSLDLVDIPPDPKLKKEAMAQEIIHKFRTIRVRAGKTERVPSIQLVDKDEIAKMIGHSPDRMDAFVLALTEKSANRARITWVKRNLSVVRPGTVRPQSNSRHPNPGASKYND